MGFRLTSMVVVRVLVELVVSVMKFELETLIAATGTTD